MLYCPDISCDNQTVCRLMKWSLQMDEMVTPTGQGDGQPLSRETRVVQ